jgi:hypothetical protein
VAGRNRRILPPAERALARLGLGGLLAARVALAALGLRECIVAGCGAAAQGGILRGAEIPQVQRGGDNKTVGYCPSFAKQPASDTFGILCLLCEETFGK